MCYSFIWKFLRKGLADLLILGSLNNFRSYCKIEPLGKSNGPQDSQRIVHEGFERFKRSSGHFNLHIFNTSLCQILNLVLIDVEKQRVYCQVSPERIFFGSANLDLWHPRVIRILFISQVDKINRNALNFDNRSLKVLWFFTITLHDTIVFPFLSLFVFQGVWIDFSFFDINLKLLLTNYFSKFLTKHVV